MYAAYSTVKAASFRESRECSVLTDSSDQHDRQDRCATIQHQWPRLRHSTTTTALTSRAAAPHHARRSLHQQTHCYPPSHRSPQLRYHAASAATCQRNCHFLPGRPSPQKPAMPPHTCGVTATAVPPLTTHTTTMAALPAILIVATSTAALPAALSVAATDATLADRLWHLSPICGLSPVDVLRVLGNTVLLLG